MANSAGIYGYWGVVRTYRYGVTAIESFGVTGQAALAKLEP